MSLLLKIVGAAVGSSLVGLGTGVVIGRFTLEHSWAQPFEQATATSGGDADPSPPAGTKVLKPLPIGRARAALSDFTKADPVLATVASVGASDDGFELHVVVENRGACKVTELAGVAYGFSAHGMPAPLNNNGATYVSFELKADVEPGAKSLASQKLRYADAATLSVAHVDRTKCADGTSWQRAR